MKIVHLCLGSFYPDGYSYQENMLPKFHKKQGHSVEVIASLQTFDANGKKCYMPNPGTYQNEYDIKVTRLAYKKPEKIYQKLKRYLGLYAALELANPEILFIHGCQFLDMEQVRKYLNKHSKVKVFVDNHADFSNSATNFLSKNILHRIFWRYTASIIEPFTSKFYGVLPARVDFLKNLYHLPADKCELLVMGADDDAVEAASKLEIKETIRSKYGISDDDFLIVTGGKIDQWKKQTLLLMEAVKKIDNPKIKLIMFGSVATELQNKVDEYVDGNRILNLGWIKSEDSYLYFAAADLVVFPGRHSVFWEQVVAQGIPMICKEWDGTKHVDIGGNVRFLMKDSAMEIKEEIEYLVNNPYVYQKMLCVAESELRLKFLYSSIAERAIR